MLFCWNVSNHWRHLLCFDMSGIYPGGGIPYIQTDVHFYIYTFSSCFCICFFWIISVWKLEAVYVQAHSVLLSVSTVKGSISAAPDVGREGRGGRGEVGGGVEVLLSVSKIDGKERQPGSVAAAQGESRVVRQKTTLKTICTRIPSVSKSSGERVPLDRKTY